MIIEIDDSYIDWVQTQPSGKKLEMTKEEITSYVNEVLNNHRKSWNLDDDE